MKCNIVPYYMYYKYCLCVCPPGVAVSEDGLPTFVINPNTLLLCSNGRVRFTEASRARQISNYVAPETSDCLDVSNTAAEKVG
jgi:hypothetical protein